MAWYFSDRDMDRSVRPQDDFFEFANGGWRKRNPIPPSEAYWGVFKMLRVKTEKQLKAIVEELSRKRAAPGTAERMVKDFYASGMDTKQRNRLGLAPLETYRRKIAAIENREDFERVLAELHLIGSGGFWNMAVDQDSKAPESYILHLYQGGLSLPERDYYLNNDPESARIRAAYRPYLEAMLERMGKDKSEAEAIIRFETALARASMKKEDRRDAEKTYHKKTVTALKRLSPAIDWKTYFSRTRLKADAVIVMQPEFFAAVAKLLETTPLPVLKSYLDWHLVNDYAPYLTTALERASFAFYGTTLTGIPAMKPLWRRVLSVVNGSLSELLGQVYVKKHFPPEAKKEMNRIVDDLFTAYRARIKELDWMGPKTRAYAEKKLAAMNRKIGYPDTWRTYRGLVVAPDDYVGNIMRSASYEHLREAKKLGKKVDLAEWYCAPQVVNAFYNPSMNDMLFPAGILQPPFFTLGGDDAINYGCIGMTIGHEITHGFDDQGSKFDHRGNLKSWWTKEDRARFEAKASIVKRQYDRYEVAKGSPVNGALTLGENIADFGGLAIAYDAYQLRLKKTGRRNLRGLTPEQRFFLGFALFERQNERLEFLKTQVKTDPHAPGIFRINGPLSNFDAFYDAYGLAKGDKLHRAPKDRVRIW
jgi:putative endopeptidase